MVADTTEPDNPGRGKLQVSAYAKVNLTLEVIGRRDDGFHDVATLLQTVDLADTLTLQPLRCFGGHVRRPGAVW